MILEAVEEVNPETQQDKNTHCKLGFVWLVL
jgi:hypothetical protein